MSKVLHVADSDQIQVSFNPDWPNSAITVIVMRGEDPVTPMIMMDPDRAYSLGQTLMNIASRGHRFEPVDGEK